MLEAGEGLVDITPPLGIELAGFHKPAGHERKITGIRRVPSARALILRTKGTSAVIISLDVCGFSREFAQRVQKRASRTTGVPAARIRVCATHTHSMPTLRFFRQWGAVSQPYTDWVEDRAVRAVGLAAQDLAPADFYLGKDRVVGGNFNRTSKTWKTDAEFNSDSADSERWLDTTLYALHFLREKPKRSLIWYQFSAHPVCYSDQQAGPDWPGLVTDKFRERDGLEPSFLQGHAGDVNPGTGDPSLGDPDKVSEAVYAALHHAVNHSSFVKVDEVRLANRMAELPLNIELLKDQLERYRKDPAQCATGEWVDAAFAKDWFVGASKWNLKKASYSAPTSAMRLGEVGLFFHPAELYSYYGLKIRLESPFGATVVIGYCDDFVGYVTDPAAYEKNEYAAIVVPKILDLPPFKAETGRNLSAAAVALLKKLNHE